MLAGDGNQDGMVDNLDKNDKWYIEFNSLGYFSGDYNRNSQVDPSDLIQNWNENAGNSSKVPE